jgi:hypothetical protein
MYFQVFHYNFLFIYLVFQKILSKVFLLRRSSEHWVLDTGFQINFSPHFKYKQNKLQIHQYPYKSTPSCNDPDITEISLKQALNTITTPPFPVMKKLPYKQKNNEYHTVVNKIKIYY